ncbi:MAG: glycerate kinase [Capsulimonas sp.]|uniref:glycerate kinase family protein n=1 Tax=Capsulimonas sp. TaxID=2494211 RepID=UPI003263DCC2
MKVVIAPDSFKGSLSAREAAQAMAAGVRRAWPQAQIVLLPLADGGEGTAEALTAATGGRLVEHAVTGPLGETVQAIYGLLGTDGGRAVVEMAQAAGLTLVPEGSRDPRLTTTFGVGELIQAALDTGVREIVVGLGGSATNDGGAGAMQALGVRFLDRLGKPLPWGGAALSRLARIDLDNFIFPSNQVRVIAASDVRNPLIGPDGASAVYGPQKGANAEMVAQLDAALTQYAEILKRDLGCDVAGLPGAGAGGGLGAAMSAFLHAEFRPGIDVVLDAAGFEATARGADWILTGEGRIDRQTLSGKTISGLLSRSRTLGVPVLAFGGSVDQDALEDLSAQGLIGAIPLVAREVTLTQAMQEPARVLEDAVANALVRLPTSSS